MNCIDDSLKNTFADRRFLIASKNKRKKKGYYIAN